MCVENKQKGQIKQYFKSVSSKDMVANKQFYGVVKPFFSNKPFFILIIIFRLMIKLKLFLMR